jgi:hypothetical protein
MARNSDFSFRFDLDSDAGTIVATLREKDSDGEHIPVDSKSFALASIPADVRAFSDLYGLSKLIQDRSSQVRLEVEGPQAKLEEMQSVYDSLVAGKIERDRKTSSPTVSAEIEALAIFKSGTTPGSVTVADIQRSIGKYTKDQKEKIFSNPEIVRIAADLRARRSEGEIDLGSLL